MKRERVEQTITVKRQKSILDYLIVPTKFKDLPMDVVGMIAKFGDEKTLLSLASTNKDYRAGLLVEHVVSCFCWTCCIAFDPKEIFAYTPTNEEIDTLYSNYKKEIIETIPLWARKHVRTLAIAHIGTEYPSSFYNGSAITVKIDLSLRLFSKIVELKIKTGILIGHSLRLGCLVQTDAIGGIETLTFDIHKPNVFEKIKTNPTQLGLTHFKGLKTLKIKGTGQYATQFHLFSKHPISLDYIKLVIEGDYTHTREGFTSDKMFKTKLFKTKLSHHMVGKAARFNLVRKCEFGTIGRKYYCTPYHTEHSYVDTFMMKSEKIYAKNVFVDNCQTNLLETNIFRPDANWKDVGLVTVPEKRMLLVYLDQYPTRFYSPVKWKVPPYISDKLEEWKAKSQ